MAIFAFDLHLASSGRVVDRHAGERPGVPRAVRQLAHPRRSRRPGDGGRSLHRAALRDPAARKRAGAPRAGDRRQQHHQCAGDDGRRGRRRGVPRARHDDGRAVRAVRHRDDSGGARSRRGSCGARSRRAWCAWSCGSCIASRSRASSTRVRRMPQAVIAANHASFLDGLLLGAFLPGDPIFAVDTLIAKQWWAKPFLVFVNALAGRSDQSAVDPRDDSRGRGRVGLHHLSRGPHHHDRVLDEGLRRARRHRRAHEGRASPDAHRRRRVHAVLAAGGQGPSAPVSEDPDSRAAAATC